MNNFLNGVKAQYRRILNKIFKTLHKTVYFENKFGVKSYNKIQFVLPKDVTFPYIEISPKVVYLSFDALKDEYTHLDVPLTESPHVEMVSKVMNNEDIGDTCYVKCEINGCLDGRYELPNKARLIKMHNRAALSEVNKRCPLLYKLGDRYYVLDGKHRLSSAFLRQEEYVKCILIPLKLLATHAYTQGVYNRMIKNKKKYTKNIRHIQGIIMLSCSPTKKHILDETDKTIFA